MTRPLRRAASAALLAVICVVLLGLACVVTGRNAIVVTHGVSMNPVYYQGDLVVVQRQTAYHVGEIVAYRRPGKDSVVLHRIVGGDESGWTFKGDNNQSIDPTKPVQSQLIGRAVLHISRGGIWLHRLTAPPLLAAYAFLLLIGGSAATRTRRQRRKDLRTMAARHRAKPCTKLGALPPVLCPVAFGAAGLGLVGVALSGVAWLRPTQHVVAIPASIRTTTQFSYVAQVRTSAAYDGTTVTAPQPVFRRLTNDVDVTYAYRGRPGALTVTVELASSSGWSATVPVATKRIGGEYDGTVHLDLAALQHRADAAARVTGLPAGEVSVAVVPHVSLAGGGSVAPRFALSLTELVLKPTGDLVVEAGAKSTGSRLERAFISVLGHGLAVSRARLLGGLALLLSLLAAAALAAITRLTGPVGEADRVRARYGDLILSVHPIVLAAGRPVVDVPDVDSLARLAERYGLLVLHWSRGGVDTYVVQDESTTYRYRTEQPAQVAINL